MRQRTQEYLRCYLMLLPSIFLFLLVRATPLIGTFVLSLFKWSVIEEPIFVGFKNFLRLPSDKVFWKALLNTLLYAVYVVPCSILLGILLASVVNRKLPGIHFFRVAYFVPYVIPLVFVGLIWKYLLETDRGLINNILSFIHIGPIPWLTSTGWALPAVAIVGIWTVLPFNMIVLLAGLQAVPDSYKESARIDGAGAWRIMWQITVPLLKPTLFFVAFMGLTRTFRVFDIVYVMTQGGPSNATNTLVFYIYNYGFKYLELGYASAASVVLFILIFVLTIVQKRMFRE